MTPFERIKETAKKNGLSLQDTATKAGIGINTIYGWKRYVPASDKLQAVADALHVTTDYLLGNTDDPNPAPKAGKPTAVDLAKANVFMYQGDQVDVEGIDPDDWAIIKAVLDRNRKNRKIGK
jgi:transcriptional regulator with XRE-family HTH domain